jgi:hypothetical protein
VYDNVIPSSNSILARNLKKLAFYFENRDYEQIAKQMLLNVEEPMVDYGSGYSNWALLMMDFLEGNYEVVICGNDAFVALKELQQHYYPQVIWAGTVKNELDFSFLQSRFVNGNTLIYVCQNNTCQLPVESISEVKKILDD